MSNALKAGVGVIVAAVTAIGLVASPPSPHRLRATTGYVTLAEKGAASGVASLTAAKALTEAQLPFWVRGTVETKTTSGASTKLNLTSHNTFAVTLTTNTEVSLEAAAKRPVEVVRLFWKEDATGGRTVAFKGVRWVGTKPTFSTAAKSESVVTFLVREGNTAEALAIAGLSGTYGALEGAPVEEGGGGGGGGAGCSVGDPFSESNAPLEKSGCEFAGTGNAGATTECSAGTTGTLFTSSDGQKVENLHIAGNLVIQNKNVTVKNVCVEHNGGAELSTTAVLIKGGSTGTVITNTTIRGKNRTTESDGNAIQLNESGAGLTLIKSVLANCGECIHYGNGSSLTIKKTLIDANGQSAGGHYEDIYAAGLGAETLTIEEGSTLLNPHAQTADVFMDTNLGTKPTGACKNTLTITHSLLAGGRATMYPCGNAESSGGSLTITNDHFARCIGTAVENGEDTKTCSGLTYSSSTNLDSPLSDGNGYFPFYGSFGGSGVALTASFDASKTWSGNVRDDNGETIASP